MKKTQLRSFVVLLVIILCMTVSHILQAVPATYNLTFTASGKYEFTDKAFTISLTGDTDDLVSNDNGLFYEGITGTLNGPAEFGIYNQIPDLFFGIQAETNPGQSLLIGDWKDLYLDLNPADFSTDLSSYDLSTPIGPLTYNADVYYSNLSPLFPKITFNELNLSNITFEASSNDSSILYNLAFTASGKYEFTDKAFTISLTGVTDDIINNDDNCSLYEGITGTLNGPAEFGIYNQIPDLIFGIQHEGHSLLIRDLEDIYLELDPSDFSTDISSYDLSTPIGPLTYNADVYYSNLSPLFPKITFDEFNLSNITFEAKTIAPVPEPATIYLFFLSLFILVCFRKIFNKKGINNIINQAFY